MIVTSKISIILLVFTSIFMKTRTIFIDILGKPPYDGFVNVLLYRVLKGRRVT